MTGFEVVGRLGISREGVGVQARCGVVQLLAQADLGQTEAFRIVFGLVLTLQEPRKLALQGGQPLGLANQLGPAVGRVGLLRSPLMAALEGGEGLGEPALASQGETQIAIGPVEVWFQANGLPVGGDRLVGLPLHVQGEAEV